MSSARSSSHHTPRHSQPPSLHHTQSKPNFHAALTVDSQSKSNFKGFATTRQTVPQTESRLLAQNQRSHVNSILRQDFEKKLAQVKNLNLSEARTSKNFLITSKKQSQVFYFIYLHRRSGEVLPSRALSLCNFCEFDLFLLLCAMVWVGRINWFNPY